MKYSLYFFCSLTSTYYTLERKYNISVVSGGDKMKQVIYVDILIMLNTVVTFIMLLTTSALTGVKNSVGRLLLGAVTGGLFSLVLLAPEMSLPYILLTKAAMAVSLVCISFKIRDLKRFFVCIALFLGTNLFFAGVMYGVDCLFSPNFISTRNGFSYFNIGSIGIIVLCVAVYGVIRLLRKYVLPDDRKPHIYDIEITVGEKTVRTKALLDTGNSVTDSVSSDVIIVDSSIAGELTGCTPDCFNAFDEQKLEALRESGFAVRLLPVEVLGDRKMLLAFSAEKAIIEAESGSGVLKKPCVAVTTDRFEDLGYSALLAQNAMC